jgi:FkbM family methyltransferase
MLISLQEIIKKYHPKLKGSIHVGSHWAEEYEDYKAAGMIKQVWIEPCEAAFMKMVERVNDENVIMIKCACGEQDAESVLMFTSPENQGQSNSLLPPDLHLQQHPEIKFNETELVTVRRLDSLEFNKSEYNFLAMDVQGYEGFVLKGATETLKHIDYIYTEVNRGSTYKNNTLIEEMDLLLSDFERVETYWPSPSWTWGDAFYIRKTLLNGN